MTFSLSRVPVSAIVAAAIGCLQPGIDPVFLALLSQTSGLDPHAHGWVVGATQGGMAAGALLVWRGSEWLPKRIGLVAALVAVLGAVTTAFVHDATLLLIVRGVFGAAMGIVYTEAMTRAAVRRPTGAYAAVFLTQLLLSTLVALLLPALSEAASPRLSLLALAIAPATLVVLSARADRRELAPADADSRHAIRGARSGAAWALAFATFAFICATMAIWSSTATLAIDAGFDATIIGQAVAIGSIAGAVTAVALMRERRWLPLALTGFGAAACLVSPLLLTPVGDPRLFVAAIILLNIGSTAIIVRCSGAATAASDDPLFRRFVACTHPLGMIAGPVMAAALTGLAGFPGLEVGAWGALALGCVALLAAGGARQRAAGATAAGSDPHENIHVAT